MDLLIELSPERFHAVEAKTAERVAAGELKGVRKLAGEYGADALASVRIACRTERAYPLEGPGQPRAVPVGGPGGLLEEVMALVTARG